MAILLPASPFSTRAYHPPAKTPQQKPVPNQAHHHASLTTMPASPPCQPHHRVRCGHSARRRVPTPMASQTRWASFSRRPISSATTWRTTRMAEPSGRRRCLDTGASTGRAGGFPALGFRHRDTGASTGRVGGFPALGFRHRVAGGLLIPGTRRTALGRRRGGSWCGWLLGARMGSGWLGSRGQEGGWLCGLEGGWLCGLEGGWL